MLSDKEHCEGGACAELNGVPMNMKLGVLVVHDGKREIMIPRLYL
jgi:hypothetical protein